MEWCLIKHRNNFTFTIRRYIVRATVSVIKESIKFCIYFRTEVIPGSVKESARIWNDNNKN
jgi:hypothetical protein